MKKLAQQSRKAALALACVSTQQKNQALEQMAEALRKNAKAILRANARDLQSAKKRKLSSAFQDRLLLNEPRIAAMAESLEEIAKLPDPVGQVISSWKRPNGLVIQKVRIPIGVIGIIYEARPNVTSDAAALCLKSGNAVILRGGSEAFHSNRLIAKVLAEVLKKAGLPKEAIQVPQLPGRESIHAMLKLDEFIDLIIPRGGEALIRHVVKHSRIPVIKHFQGICHLYIDESADAKMAIEIAVNAKVSRPGVCNAIETLLVHRSHASTLLPALVRTLQDHGVEIRGTPEVAKHCQGVKKAKASDFGKEFLDLILAVKMVDSLQEAISHIERFGSQHTEAMVTSSQENAQKFLQTLQSSVVLVNASTRFADGGEMGMGAEIGISTTKLHAFGPMGLADLTIPHYRIQGSGQIR